MLDHQDFLDECARGLREHRLKGRQVSPALRRQPVPFSPDQRLKVAHSPFAARSRCNEGGKSEHLANEIGARASPSVHSRVRVGISKDRCMTAALDQALGAIAIAA